MKATYELPIKAACPIDDGADVYRCTIESARQIDVESIIQECAGFTEQKLFQEQICESLSRTLGAMVTLVGIHSGVVTTVVCGEIP